jgi:hypothetical protein
MGQSPLKQRKTWKFRQEAFMVMYMGNARQQEPWGMTWQQAR